MTPTTQPSLDVCFTPELLSLFDLRGRVAVVVDILRATSSMVTALAAGVTHIVPLSELEECRTYAAQGYLTAAERDGRQAAGFDLGNSPFGYLDEASPVRGRAVAITTTNGTRALQLSLTADAVVVGAFLNLAAVADFARQQGKDVVVVCAGWKGNFNLEDSIFAGALAELLAPDFDITSSDATLAAHQLWLQAKPDLASYLLQSAHVRRLNNLEANKDMDFCVRLNEYNLVPIWRDGRIVVN